MDNNIEILILIIISKIFPHQNNFTKLQKVDK